MTTMMNRVEMNDTELDMVNGGNLDRCPKDEQLAEFGLSDIIHCTGGWLDVYYDTYRGDGVWKNVGSEDMLRYVERTYGSDSAFYKNFYEYCYYVQCRKNRTGYNIRKIG